MTAPYLLANVGSVAGSLPNNVLTQIDFTNVEAEGYGMTLVGGKAVIPQAGIYTVEYAVTLDMFGAGTVANFLSANAVQNGVTKIGGSACSTATAIPASFGCGKLICAEGDLVSIEAQQNSGEAQPLCYGSTAFAVFMHVTWWGVT